MKDQKKVEIAKKQYKKLANRPLSKERKKAVSSASSYLFTVMLIALVALVIYLVLH
ncbi:hypothetical protein [Latilactobacillus fuchuensis]|uniref:Uncharacterized protein n=1 Tax=Latilactobacillus fuchuensis DSM 14340 = JCM 11249 TaxID=1423747 RepID=A0A0R1S6Z3_9LACO|nr:hypothetical protein [Latilactobacillus fuchuensis]KRL61243.1 hypothetical protein FC69_GL000891 [Latilactobacillus fuchuensis DSM 14340 = JCM 11249]